MTKGGTIPAPNRFPLSRAGRQGVGSRFRGNDVSPGIKGDGARCAPSWRYRADWIPACAGMTERGVCRLPQGRGREIHNGLASRGVSARYYAGGALADCLRVSVGTSSGADKLLAALKSALG